MKIVIPENISVIPEKYFYELKKLGKVTTYNDFPKNPTEIIKRIKDAEVLIVKWIHLPENFLDKCKKLKYIVTLSSGYGFFPLKEARKKGISIINSPSHNSQAVAEHTIALMFSVARKVTQAHSNIMNGNWKESPYDFLGSELTDKIFLQIGYGNIGSKVAKTARGIGMKVLIANSKTTKEKLDNMIKKADFISLNIPLTDKTGKLIDKRRVDLMKNTAYLINTARGGVVEQKALYNALKNKNIAGAGLDVFLDTPAVGGAPSEVVKLSKLPNVVATPHMAFNTFEAGERMGKEMINNVKAILKDNPINVVN